MFTLSASSCGRKVSCSAVAKSKNGSGQIGWVVNLDRLGWSVVISVVVGSVVVVDDLVVVGDVDFTVVVGVDLTVVVDVDLTVVVLVVDVVFFLVGVDFFMGSSSKLKKSRSSRKGRVFSAVVVEDTLDDVVVDSSEEDDSFVVVEFINWSIANHVNSWFLSGVVDGFSEIMSYSSGLTDMDSNDTTEPLPRMIEGCLIGS